MTACLISKVPLGNVRHLKQGGHEVVRPGLQGQRASWVNTGVPSLARAQAGTASEMASSVDIGAESDEPRLMRFNSDHYNKVQITGVACEEPQIHTSRNGEDYAIMKLGQLHPEKGWVQSLDLVFWDKKLAQASKTLKAGTHLALMGYLSEYRNKVSIHVRDFYIVDENSAPFSEDQLQNILKTHPNDTAGDGAGAMSLGAGRIGPSKARCYELFANGMTPVKIAEERNIKETTVLGYLAEVAACGQPMQWRRLCSEAKLAPAGSIFMSVDDVDACIREVVEDVATVGFGVFNSSTIGKVRYRLQNSVEGKFKAQEGLGSGYAYSQIRIVLAMKLVGLNPNDWNGFLVEPGEPF